MRPSLRTESSHTWMHHYFRHRPGQDVSNPPYDQLTQMMGESVVVLFKLDCFIQLDIKKLYKYILYWLFEIKYYWTVFGHIHYNVNFSITVDDPEYPFQDDQPTCCPELEGHILHHTEDLGNNTVRLYGDQIAEAVLLYVSHSSQKVSFSIGNLVQQQAPTGYNCSPSQLTKAPHKLSLQRPFIS